jgi:acetyl esterase/lipase
MVFTRIRWLFAILITLFISGSASAQTADKNHIVDVVYGHKMGVALTMDVFKPEHPNGIGVIWMVSGGWVSNHSSINPGLAAIFTSKGQTVFQVVHGSQPKFALPEIVLDIHRAVRYIRTHATEYGVDPNRLGISGGSAGGHLSLYMGAYGDDGNPDAKDPVDKASSKVNAVACFFPATDFMNFGKEGVAAMTIPQLRPFWPAFGITEATTKEQLEKLGKSLSPIYGVSDKYPPTLIIHGDADTLVPIQQSQIIIKKLEEMKVPCKLVTMPGKGHGWAGWIEKDSLHLADWFADHLKGK